METWIYVVIIIGVVLVAGLVCVVLWRTGTFNKAQSNSSIPAAGSSIGNNYNPCVANVTVTLDSEITDLPEATQPGVSFNSNSSTLMMAYNPNGKAASSIIEQYLEGTATQIALNVPGLILQPRSIAALGPFMAAYAVTQSTDGTLNYSTGSTKGSALTDYGTYVIVDSFPPNGARTLNNLLPTLSNETPELLTEFNGYLYVAWFDRGTTNTTVRSYTLGTNGLPSLPADEFVLQSTRPYAWNVRGKTMVISANNVILTYQQDKTTEKWSVLNLSLPIFATSVQLSADQYYLAANSGTGSVSLYSRTDLSSTFTFLNSVTDETIGNSMTFISNQPGLLISCGSGSPKYLSCTVGAQLTTWSGDTAAAPANFVGGGVLQTISGTIYDSFYIMTNSTNTVRHYVECH